MSKFTDHATFRLREIRFVRDVFPNEDTRIVGEAKEPRLCETVCTAVCYEKLDKVDLVCRRQPIPKSPALRVWLAKYIGQRRADLKP